MNEFTLQEILSIGNFVLNTLIVPIAVFGWRMTKAIVKMEQILIDHDRRIDRMEEGIDSAARDGRLERRKSGR